MSELLEAAELAEITTHYSEAKQLAQRALAAARLDDELIALAQSHRILGDIASHQGEPQAAREHYGAALATCRGIEDAQQKRDAALAIEVSTSVALGELHLRFGETNQGKNVLDVAREMAFEAKDSGLLASVEAALASVVAQQGNPVQALALLEQSIKELVKSGDARRSAEVRARYATLLVQAGQPEMGGDEFQHAIAQQEAFGDVRGIAVSQAALATLVAQQGQPEVAQALLGAALKTLDRIGDIHEAATVRSTLAALVVQLGRPREGVALYEAALRVVEQLGDRRGQAVIAHAMAGLRRQMGETHGAMEAYKAALQGAEAMGDVRGAAIVQHSLAELMGESGQAQEAIAMEQKALDTFVRLGDLRGCAISRSNLAGLSSQFGQSEDALELYQAALRDFEQVGERRGVAVTQVAMATLFARIGRQEESLALAETALKTHQALGDPRQLARVQATFAELLRQGGHLDEAEKGLRVSLDLYERQNDRRGISTTHAALARISAELGDKVGAETHYRQALAIAEESNDRRGVAVTQLNFAQWLYDQFRFKDALILGWEAHGALLVLGYEQDAIIARNLLEKLVQQLGAEVVTQLWQENFEGQESPIGLARDVEISRRHRGGFFEYPTIKISTEKISSETKVNRSNLRPMKVANIGRWVLLLALFVQVIPWQAAKAQTSTNAQSDAGEIRFEDYLLPTTDYTLPNGMRVILAEDHSAPVVAVDIWYHVGGANDPQGRSGFAHLFEHMMFEGSANIPEGQWDTLLEPIGGLNNAYTQNDKTAFWELAPSNQLPRLLWMESDRLRSLDVTEEAYENQRDVVIQEYNQRVANAPYGTANSRLFTQPLAGYPPYELPVIGSVEDLESAPFSDVKAFHDEYYKPNNATITVVGDIDIAQTQALIQAYFGDIPAGEAVPSILDQYPLPDQFPVTATDEASGCKLGTEEVIVDTLAGLPRWAMSVVGPLRGTPDYYALDVLSMILSSGNSSRLEREIVQKGKAAAAFVGLQAYLGTSVFYGAIYPNSGDDLADAPALLQTELEKVRKEGITEEELDRAKRQLVANAISSYRGSVRDTAEWIQDATLTFGSPDGIATELEAYEAVTAEQVQQAAQSYTCDRPINVQKVVQSGDQVTADEAALQLGEPVTPTATATPEPLVLPESDIDGLPEGTVTITDVPATLGELTTNFPPFVQFTLDNGLNVIFVEQHEIPKVQLQLVVGGSDKQAPEEKQGVADLMTMLLTKGTVKKSANKISDLIENVGGSISASSALEWTIVSADALKTDTKLAFDLLSEVARYSTFPQSELDVAKTQTYSSLQLNATDPSTLADHQFGRVAFAGHPYSYIETEETVDGITRDDIRTFHRTYYRPNNALLIIVGDMTADEAKAQTERSFGAWMTADVPELFDYPEAQPADTSSIYLVDRPDSEQSTIQIGNVAIDARNPDRYALEVVNSVLGGGSSARLYKNLREDKGYTYGVYSRFARPNDKGTFRVLGDFNQDNTGASVTEILGELKQIREEPISDEELENAKGKIVGDFSVSLEDPGTFASQLASRALTGIPIDELNEYIPSIEAITADQAQAAAQKYIESDAPIIVVVGSADAVTPQLEPIKSVHEVDADGNEVAK